MRDHSHPRANSMDPTACGSNGCTKLTYETRGSGPKAKISAPSPHFRPTSASPTTTLPRLHRQSKTPRPRPPHHPSKTLPHPHLHPRPPSRTPRPRPPPHPSTTPPHPPHLLHPSTTPPHPRLCRRSGGRGGRRRLRGGGSGRREGGPEEGHRPEC